MKTKTKANVARTAAVLLVICASLAPGLSGLSAAAKPYRGAEYRTRQAFTYGRFEVRMKSAAVSGMLASFFTYAEISSLSEWNEIDIENMGRDIKEFVAAAAAEGAPCWKVFWPQCHTEKAFQEKKGFGNSGFPFTSEEYADAASVDYSQVGVPNARWHEQHTFTCFAYPTYSEENMRQIAAALVKVIKAFS